MLIAQVSDIHAASDNDHLLRFERVLTWLAHLRPDLLVLTGDLIDGPWAEGYRQIAARLKQQPYPAFVLPGNADDRHLMRAVWSDNIREGDPAVEAMNFVHDADGLRLIGLDTTVAGQDYGSVTGQLEWLSSQLTDSPSLLFMHHHVASSGIPTLDKSMCKGLAALEELIHRSSASLLAICSGHVHRPMASSFAGVPAYICGSVCPANPVWFGTEHVPPVSDPPALMIYRYASRVLSSYPVSV